MTFSLMLVLRASQPTLDAHLDNRLLLGLGFLIVIFALIACVLLLDHFSKSYERSADWIKYKPARHHRKRAVLRKHYPPLRVVKSNLNQAETSLARDALRRNAEAATAGDSVTRVRPRANLRLVKSREKAYSSSHLRADKGLK